MKRKIAGLFIASVLALGASVGLAGSATAATADCPVGYSCQWRDTGYRSGTVEAGHFSFYQCQHDFSLRAFAGVGGNGDNSVTSVSNRGRTNTAFYFLDAGYNGPQFWLYKGTGDGNLSDSVGNAPGGFNDNLSSGQFDSAPIGCK